MKFPSAKLMNYFKIRKFFNGGFYKLALTDFRIYFEDKMLADKGCAPPRNGGEAKRRGCKDH